MLLSLTFALSAVPPAVAETRAPPPDSDGELADPELGGDSGEDIDAGLSSELVVGFGHSPGEGSPPPLQYRDSSASEGDGGCQVGDGHPAGLGLAMWGIAALVLLRRRRALPTPAGASPE